MARNKYPEVTEARILEAATKLFLSKGYEKTTIQDIVDELGDLTRGAVYHHFKSKDEIIEAVCSRMTTGGEMLGKIVYQEGLTGLEKLEQIMRATSSSNRPDDELNISLQFVIQESINPRFIQRELESVFEEMAPMFQHIIEEGNRDGSMNVPCPREAAEVFGLLLSIWVNRDIHTIGAERFVNKVHFLRYLFDLMGLPLIDDQYVEECRQLYARAENILQEQNKLP